MCVKNVSSFFLPWPGRKWGEYLRIGVVTLVRIADPTVLNKVVHLFVGVGPPHAISKTLPGFFDSKMAAVQTIEHR